MEQTTKQRRIDYGNESSTCVCRLHRMLPFKSELPIPFCGWGRGEGGRTGYFAGTWQSIARQIITFCEDDILTFQECILSTFLQITHAEILQNVIHSFAAFL